MMDKNITRAIKDDCLKIDEDTEHSLNRIDKFLPSVNQSANYIT